MHTRWPASCHFMRLLTTFYALLADSDNRMLRKSCPTNKQLQVSQYLRCKLPSPILCCFSPCGLAPRNNLLPLRALSRSPQHHHRLPTSTLHQFLLLRIPSLLFNMGIEPHWHAKILADDARANEYARRRISAAGLTELEVNGPTPSAKNDWPLNRQTANVSLDTQAYPPARTSNPLRFSVTVTKVHKVYHSPVAKIQAVPIQRTNVQAIAHFLLRKVLFGRAGLQTALFKATISRVALFFPSHFLLLHLETYRRYVFVSLIRSVCTSCSFTRELTMPETPTPTTRNLEQPKPADWRDAPIHSK